MWNRIEESSTEDETLGTSFFTNGLFKISNDEKSVKDPVVLSLLQKKRLFIAVDSSLILLEDCDSIDCKFIAFGAEINCFAVSRNGNYVVCCLSDGNIHGVHIKAIPIFNLIVNDEDINQHGATFVDIHMNADDKCLILCSNGAIYEMSSIDESEMQINVSTDQLGDSTCIMNQTALTTPLLDRISSVSLKNSSKINCFCSISTFYGECYLIGCNDYVLLLDGSHVTRLNYPEGSRAIKKIINLDNFVVGLTHDGLLLEICSLTGLMRKIAFPNDLIIDDVRIVESRFDYIELMILSKPSQNEREMQVIDFPALKSKSQLNLPATSWIIPQSKSAVTMYFIEGYKNDEGFAQTIEIKSITDTDPEQRFHKLLLRGQFVEAENFAVTCGLSLEPLHQTRVKKSLIEMSCARSPEALEEKFVVLMQQLPLIEDKTFLVSLKLSQIPDRTCLTKFLEYILSNINTNNFPDETNEINELLLRLETLRLIDPDDTNMRWQRFLEERDMQKAATEYFKTDVLLSCLVWSRHASSIIPNLNLQKFYGWLTRIPTTKEPFQLIQWLKHFAPCFLQAFPEETTKIVDWCLERTRALQFSTAWPEIGLEFVNNINVIFQDMKFLHVDIRRSYHSNMEKILKLIHILEEMVVLKKTYHLIISLDDYCRNSIEETAFKLLQRIQIHNLSKLVNDFLYPIFMEHGLLPEDTIVRYIQFLANNKNLGYWQDRAVTAIDLLTQEEHRLNCALLILKVSPVPWGDAVMPLAKFGTTSSHPIANSILVEYKSQAIKMIKIKYGWPVDYFDFQQDRIQLVFRILKLNLPDMIVDVKTLIESSPDIAHDAYIHLIFRLVEVGEIEEFFQLILSIDCDQEKVIVKTIDVFITYLDSDMIETEVIPHFIEALKILLGRLKDFVDEFKYNQQMKQIDLIKNVISLRNDLKMSISLKDLQKPQTEKLNESIDVIVAEIQRDKLVDGVWSKVNLIARAFNQNQIQVFNYICQKLNNVFITCHFVECLCDGLDNIIDKKEIESAIHLAVLMLSQQIITLENNAFNMAAQPFDPLAFPLAYELLRKCLAKYDSTTTPIIMELITSTEIVCRFYSFDVIKSTANDRKIDTKIFSSPTKRENSNGTSKGNKRDSLSMFDKVVEEPHHAAIVTVKQQLQCDESLKPVLECVSNALKLIAFAINSQSRPYDLFVKHLEIDNAQQIKDNFFCSLEHVLKQKLNMTAFAVIHFVMAQQNLSKVTVLPRIFVSTVGKKILKFMLSQKEPEYLNAFIILRSEKNQLECLDYLKQSLKNNSQRIAFSTFSEMYNKYKKSDECVVDREARLKLYYYSELTKQYPNLKAPSNLDSIGISEFLKDLEKRQLSLDLLKKLCKDFGWHYQKMLVRQVKIVLNSQSLDYEIKTDQFGKDEVIVKTSVEQIRKLCMLYLTEITDMTMLAAELEKIFIEVTNVYFYELYLVVIDLLEYAKDLSPHYLLYRSILLFLKLNLTFKRRSVETDELEDWIKNHAGLSEGSVMPVISNYRLPFKLIIQSRPEYIIGKDFNVETFEIYYPLIKIHADPANINERVEICSIYAAKNSIQDLQAQAGPSAGTSWNLKPRNNAFLQAVLRMVTFISNKAKVLATLYFIMNNTPRGCDQMEAAHECWKYAMANEESIRSQHKYHDVVEKVNQKYPLLKTQHLLYLYGVYDDKLMQLIDNPIALINVLYHHESILGTQKKEINKLCKELAELHGLEILSIQNKLLQNWLAFVDVSTNEEHGSDVNETVYEDFMGTAATAHSAEDTAVSDENVIRAYYVLSSWKSGSALDFLASELNSSVIVTENQMQLYECFAKLINEECSSYLELVNPETYMVIRVCHYLKGLGFNMRPEKFTEIDKVELLKNIWTAHFNSTKGLEVMALICLSYNIHLPQIWNGILKQMVVHKMIKHLSILVEVLSTKTKLLHLSSLKVAWEFVIHEPFIHASKVKNYEQDFQISKSFILLQKCPISTFLNLKAFAERCMQLDRPHMAAMFIAFAKEGERDKIIAMVSSSDKRELKKNIEELEEFGVAPVLTKFVICTLQL